MSSRLKTPFGKQWTRKRVILINRFVSFECDANDSHPRIWPDLVDNESPDKERCTLCLSTRICIIILSKGSLVKILYRPQVTHQRSAICGLSGRPLLARKCLIGRRQYIRPHLLKQAAHLSFCLFRSSLSNIICFFRGHMCSQIVIMHSLRHLLIDKPQNFI